jgi:hypothetical protein
MKEKLLAALKTKFQGVQDATLDRIATKKAETITEEDQIQNVVDGLKMDDIIQSETDFRVSQASKTAREKAVREYEEKHNLKDGKPQKAEDPPEDPPGDDDEKIPKWAQGLIKENKELKTTLQGITKSQEVGTKKEQALKIMAESKIPEKLREKWVGRIILDSDTPLEDQVKELETEFVDLQQETINNAVKEGTYVPGSGGGSEFKKEEVDDYLNEKFPEEAEK